MSELLPYENHPIRTLLHESEERYISLDDLCAGNLLGSKVIRSWLRMRPTLGFLGNWENLHNPDFVHPAFDEIERASRQIKFDLKITEWIKETQAVGLLRRRRDGDMHTFAHPDIALEFATHLSPEFRIYLFKEFQRLKNEESERREYDLQWSVRRELSKINYRIHSAAVKKYIPPKVDDLGKRASLAAEGDLLNIALFGKTAKEWRVENSDKTGNIRDEATLEQLTVLANLENLNAYLMEHGFQQDERLEMLNTEAIKQMELLLSYDAVKGLEQIGEQPKKLSDKKK